MFVGVGSDVPVETAGDGTKAMGEVEEDEAEEIAEGLDSDEEDERSNGEDEGSKADPPPEAGDRMVDGLGGVRGNGDATDTASWTTDEIEIILADRVELASRIVRLCEAGPRKWPRCSLGP